MYNSLQAKLNKSINFNSEDPSYAVNVDTGMHFSQYTEEITGDIVQTAKITPSTGKKLCIRQVSIITNSNNETVSLDFASSAIAVARLYAAAQTRISENFGHLVGAADEALSITIAGGAGTQKTFISVMYVEHD